MFLLLAIFLLLELYVYQAVKTITSNQWARVAYIVVSALVYGVLFFEAMSMNRSDKNPFKLHLVVTLFLVFVLPKLLVVIFLLLEDIGRIFGYGYGFFTKKVHFMEGRRSFISYLGLGVGAVLSGFFIDGVLFGKYRHSVRKVKLNLKGLPKSFRGYKIIQISDVHSGSFSDPSKLEHAIELINSQNPDLVLFTGDMVNNRSEEFLPFISLFSKIKAKDGKFSVLGNHDYGDYVHWETKEEKIINLEKLIEYEKQAGFVMLRNQHRIVEKNGEQLYILGVENWGLKPFPQYGKIEKALEGVPNDATKILMSHDPSHFDHVITKLSTKIDLTLSGHTHGMQFGLDLKNIKWSPVQYKYPKWVDLYESKGRFLYVNRGFGVLAYPGRVGVDPEITLFELQ